MSNCTGIEEHLGPQQDPLYVIVPIIIIYVIIFVTGTIGNISTCIVIAKNKSMHTATNYYLFSLAISDLLLLLSGLPQEIYMIYSKYPYIFGSVFCFLRGMFAETSANATVLTITAFTIERYLAICHPFLSHTMSKLTRAVKIIIFIWILALTSAIPLAMPFSIVGNDCKLCQFNKPIINYSFEISTLVFFVLPMTLITVLYVLIGKRLRSSHMMKQRNGHFKVQSRSSRKVVKMLVAVVVAFFICWAPFHVQRLFFWYSTISANDKETRDFYTMIYNIVTYTSGILYYISATINPILYNIMSVKFREAFKETFARFCGIGGFKNNKPQRSYSAMSRSLQRGPESSDSARDDPSLLTHTTLTRKNSIESSYGLQSHLKRYRNATLRNFDIEEEDTQNMEWINEIPVHKTDEVNEVNNKKKNTTYTPTTDFCMRRPMKQNKFIKFYCYLKCIKGKTLNDNNQKFSSPYPTPIKEAGLFFELEPTKKPQNNSKLINESTKNMCDTNRKQLRPYGKCIIEKNDNKA